jgi:diguanylate cyclase (GGDEF)-like protein/PAS domain S-box-containing protein
MTHYDTCLTILLIQNNPSVAGQIGVALAAGDAGSFEVEWVRQLSQGLERLSKKGIAAVLLDLSLPDSEGVETFDKLFAASPDVPILILAGDGSEALAKEAVSRGAQDYLVAAHLDTYSLQRALRNAVERKGIEDALYVEKERAVVTLNSIGDAVLCTDIFGRITYLNIVAEKMTGWPRAEAIGRPLAEVFRIIDGGTRQTARDPMDMAVKLNKTVGLTPNCVLIRRDGYEAAIEDSAAPIHDRSGRVIGAVIVFHDVSAARAMSLEMTHTAHHDLVTSLPNRLLLNDRITQSISMALRQSRPFAVLFLDLDNFKIVNDSLGHAGGDELLRSVSKRLLSCVRGSDTVSRQGGDEFAILLPEITHAEDAATCAAKILLALNEPYIIGSRTVHVGTSIGISLYPRDGADSETLLKSADMAMYHAKERGRGNFQFFEAAMNLRAVQRQSMESELRRALKNQEFLLHYQPKVNLDSGDITGVEALIRWQQPDGTLVLPSEFVHIAEDCGLIVPIGRWVMREACKQARAWQEAGLRHLRMAVNVSAVEFREKGFVENVRQLLSDTGLRAHYLVLELTERVLMENAESTALVLEELKTMGVHLAVDDFGTGYSSLSYLRQFPIDVLKIDQSFIKKITSNLEDSTIISAIIGMGRNLHHIVIAEGIETLEQIAYLQSQHCEEGQGYLLSPPVGAVQFGHLLETGIAAMVVN